MKTPLVRALGALAVLTVLSGCSSLLGGDMIEPAIEIPDGRAVVVVPFRDQDFANGFESPRGCDLAEKVTRILKDKSNGDFRVRSQTAVVDLYNKGDPRQLTAREVAEKTQSDYVIMGEVVTWQLQDDNTYGLYRGTAEIDITIYETADAAKERNPDEDPDDLPRQGRGRLALAKKRVSAVFPQEYGLSGVGSYEHTPKQIESGLANAISLQVAWLLVEHSKEEQKLAAGK